MLVDRQAHTQTQKQIDRETDHNTPLRFGVTNVSNIPQIQPEFSHITTGEFQFKIYFVSRN